MSCNQLVKKVFEKNCIKEENYFVENEKDLKQKLLSDNNYVQNLSNGEKFQIIREVLSDDPESLSKFMNTSFVKKIKTQK